MEKPVLYLPQCRGLACFVAGFVLWNMGGSNVHAGEGEVSSSSSSAQVLAKVRARMKAIRKQRNESTSSSSQAITPKATPAKHPRLEQAWAAIEALGSAVPSSPGTTESARGALSDVLLRLSQVESIPATLIGTDALQNLLLGGEGAISAYIRWNGETLQRRLQRETRVLGDPAHPIADAQRLVAQVNAKLASVATSYQAQEKTKLEIQLLQEELEDLEEGKAKLEELAESLTSESRSEVVTALIAEKEAEIGKANAKIVGLEESTKTHSQEISRITSTTVMSGSTESVEESLTAAQNAFRKDYATEITWNDVKTVVIENAWLAQVGDRICESANTSNETRDPAASRSGANSQSFSCGALGKIEEFWRQRVGHAFRKYREQRNRTIDVIASTRVRSGIVTVPEAQGISPALMLNLVPDGSTDPVTKFFDRSLRGKSVKWGRRRVSVPGMNPVWVPYLHETRVNVQLGVASKIEWDSGTKEAESLLTGLGLKVNKAVSLNLGWARSLENSDQDGVYYGVSVSLNNLLGIFGNDD